MMSIVVVSLNPSIDWQLSVDTFAYGGLNRVQPGKRYGSGKGINVSIALKNLGLEPLCLGFNFADGGDFIATALDESGAAHDFIMVEGAVRTNIKLYETATGTMTELNQPGSVVPTDTLSQLYDKIAGVGHMPILVLSGSISAGVPVNVYQHLCESWPGQVILDGSGESLRLALEGRKPPFCIKPNLFELETSFGVKLSTKEDIVAFCRELIKDYGVQMICVSMGSDGAILVGASEAYYVPALMLPVKGLQGAGDAMVAGLAYGLYHRLDVSQMLKIASAAAAASVVREGTLMCTREGFEEFLGKMSEPILI